MTTTAEDAVARMGRAQREGGAGLHIMVHRVAASMREAVASALLYRATPASIAIDRVRGMMIMAALAEGRCPES